MRRSHKIVISILLIALFAAMSTVAYAAAGDGNVVQPRYTVSFSNRYHGTNTSAVSKVNANEEAYFSIASTSKMGASNWFVTVKRGSNNVSVSNVRTCTATGGYWIPYKSGMGLAGNTYYCKIECPTFAGNTNYYLNGSWDPR